MPSIICARTERGAVCAIGPAATTVATGLISTKVIFDPQPPVPVSPIASLEGETRHSQRLTGLLGLAALPGAQPDSLAFPQAEGYGALAGRNDDKTFACGDRADLKVFKVKNTATTGPGSLKAIVEDSFAVVANRNIWKIVVFETGGVMPTGMLQEYGCFYIAGQTAPGDGFEVRGPAQALNIRNTSTSPDHFIWRSISLNGNKGTPGTVDAVTMITGRKAMFDHVTVAYGNDETFTITPVPGNPVPHLITFQYGIVAYGLRLHSTGSIFGCIKEGPEQSDSISLHHSLYSTNAHRNPRIGCAGTEIINVVIFNWLNRGSGFKFGAKIDLMRNHYLGGKWTPPSNVRKEVGIDAIGVDAPEPPQFNGKFLPGVHTLRNKADSSSIDTLDVQDGLFFLTGGSQPNPLPDSVIAVATKWHFPIVPVTQWNVAQNRDSLFFTGFNPSMTRIGPSIQVSCNGTMGFKTDSLTADIIRRARDNDGLHGIITGGTLDPNSTSPPDYGNTGWTSGYHSYDEGTACADTDDDGMPDAFESRYFASSTAGVRHLDPDGDGYINIEEYLNGSDPNVNQ